MVRVISVHHFTSQDIHTCDDPVSVSAAPPDRLLVALANHVVQVRDLARGGHVEFTFPTVDRVQHIQHCQAGNFVATLECGRHSTVSNFARIYINWEAPTRTPPDEMAVVRARIAGRVTPSSQQCSVGVVEMIELPVKLPPVAVACCQRNGSVVLSSGRSLTVFRYCVRTHDISRHKFVDFRESGLSMELSFVPTELSLCEDLVACFSSTRVLLFKIEKANSSTCVTPSPSPSEFVARKPVSEVIDWDVLVQSKDVADCAQFSQLDINSFPIIVDLPMLAKERISEAHRDPFVSGASDVLVTEKSSGSNGKIIYLLQLKISQGDASPHEEFRCLLLQPFQVKPKTVDQNTDGDLGVVCVVATQQEGYLYHFPELHLMNYKGRDSRQSVVTVYPFTAPVSAVVLEHSLLHALTDTGVETYTTRCGHRLIATRQPADYTNMVCPSQSQPVCLVGLRPFLGVKHLVLCDSHLILLASSEASNTVSRDGSWTLYSLSLPTPTAVYNDIISVAKTHQWTSPSVYYHLLSEAHMIVRTSRCLGENDEELEKVFSESCALLGDFYLSGESEVLWRMALPYYRMSGCSPLDVINRLTQKQIGDTDKSWVYSRGLVNYLKTCLQQMNTAPDELLFTPAVPSFINRTLDLYETSATDQVSSLVLGSKLVREYATDRVLAIMKDQLKSGPSPEPEHALALALLCIQKNFPSQALSVLNSLSSETLTVLLISNHHLLLEISRDKRRAKESLAFTELSTILFDSKPSILAQVLFKLVIAEERIYSLDQILKVFMELLPRMTNTSVLQCFLERYFAWFFNEYSDEECDATTDEALKILVRSYLSDLQRPQSPSRLSNVGVRSKEEISHVLFEECRPKFLAKMDPSSAPNHESSDSDLDKLTADDNHRDPNSLYKLQSLLASGKLSAECVAETHQFVKTHSRTRGYLSLLVLCSPTKAAATILLNFCPDALLPFCQEKFESDKEWRWIIVKLQQKIQSMDDDNFLKQNCIQILTNVLTHLSKTLSLEALLPMLPPGEKSIQSYIRTCQEMSHASHINTLLVATGHQLLNTLNL